MVPAVCQARSVDDKHSVLVNGIYEYFANHYGVKCYKLSKINPKNTAESHDRALKKVKELKNKARKELREAKRNGKLQEQTCNLAKNFFQTCACL